MKIKAKIGDELVELTTDQIELPDGVQFLSPDNVPKGYFTQKAFDEKIAEITRTKTDKARDELKSDKDFHKSILSEYNILLGDDGKPKGLKPDFDPEEWKKQNAEKLTEPYKAKLTEAETQLNQYKTGLKKAEILKHANGLFKQEYTQSFTGTDDPFVVQKFADMFDVDESGRVALKDETGFAVDGNGNRITPDKWFDSNKDKFASMLADNRQRGPNTGDGGVGSGRRFTKAEIAKMSDTEYEKHRDEIMASIDKIN
jgi:hypothetical protein